jgi:hypothetical protein
MTTAIDDVFVEDKDIVVGTDSRGHSMTVYILSERLTQLDVHDILEDAQHGDYEYVAELLTTGFRGYGVMSPGELWSEWKESEDKFYRLFDEDAFPFGFEGDPAHG